MRALGAIIAGLAFCTLAGCAAPRPGLIYQEGKMSITRMDFHGWHDCYRMSNGTVEVVLVPQVARIMQDRLLWGGRAALRQPRADARGYRRRRAGAVSELRRPQALGGAAEGVGLAPAA